jgi:hypothetical protein
MSEVGLPRRHTSLSVWRPDVESGLSSDSNHSRGSRSLTMVCFMLSCIRHRLLNNLRIYPSPSRPPPLLQHIHERRVLEIRHVVKRCLVQLCLVEPLRPQPLGELDLVLRRLGLVHD